MAKFCTACGAALADEAAICQNCGAPVTSVTDAPAEPVPMTVPYTPAPTVLNEEEQNKPLSMWTYLGLLLLYALPCVGIITAIVMCFAPKNQHIKNFSRGFVLYTVIAAIVFTLVGFFLGALITEAVLEESGAYAADENQFDVDSFFDSFEDGFEAGFEDGFETGCIGGPAFAA